MKRKKVIEINLQDKDNIQKAVNYNMEHKYEYYLEDDNNLINYDNMAYLLRVGYKMLYYNDTPLFVHKNYDYQEDI